jgi:hypothetical protein
MLFCGNRESKFYATYAFGVGVETMILDKFALHSLAIQVVHDPAYQLWDYAGVIARALVEIWPGLTLADGQPNQQSFKAPGVQVQVAVNQTTINIRTNNRPLDQARTRQIVETYDLVRNALQLENLSRLSARATHVRWFDNIQEANAAVRDMGLVRWPEEDRVFDQPVDGEKNGSEVIFRFETDSAFSVVRVRAEELRFEVELDPDFFEELNPEKVRSRAVIDFDRGLLGTVDAKKLRMEDWLKGYMHVLRRDIDKVLGPRT